MEEMPELPRGTKSIWAQNPPWMFFPCHPDSTVDIDHWPLEVTAPDSDLSLTTIHYKYQLNLLGSSPLCPLSPSDTQLLLSIPPHIYQESYNSLLISQGSVFCLVLPKSMFYIEARLIEKNQTVNQIILLPPVASLISHSSICFTLAYHACFNLAPPTSLNEFLSSLSTNPLSQWFFFYFSKIPSSSNGRSFSLTCTTSPNDFPLIFPQVLLFCHLDLNLNVQRGLYWSLDLKLFTNTHSLAIHSNKYLWFIFCLTVALSF